MKSILDKINEELKVDQKENNRPKKFEGKAVELHIYLGVWGWLDRHPNIQWYVKDENTICVKESDWNKEYNAAKNKTYLNCLLKSKPGPIKTHGYV